MLPAEKMHFFASSSTFILPRASASQASFVHYWEEIESLKSEKSSGIVLEKSRNSFFPLPYEPCSCRKGNLQDGSFYQGVQLG